MLDCLGICHPVRSLSQCLAGSHRHGARWAGNMLLFCPYPTPWLGEPSRCQESWQDSRFLASLAAASKGWRRAWWDFFFPFFFATARVYKCTAGLQVCRCAKLYLYTTESWYKLWGSSPQRKYWELSHQEAPKNQWACFNYRSIWGNGGKVLSLRKHLLFHFLNPRQVAREVLAFLLT